MATQQRAPVEHVTETPAEIAAETPAEPRVSRASGILRGVVGGRETGIAAVVIIIALFLTWQSPYFLTEENLFIVSRQFALNAIIAIGMTFVIIMGGIDLSVGSVVALASVITGFALVTWSLPVPVAILAGLAAGVAAGLTNGFLIVRTRVAPFIITLGMMGVARGLALVLTTGSSISGLPDAFVQIGQGQLLGMPIPLLVLIVLAVAAHIFLSRTSAGRHVYFVGSNEDAALLSGINVNRLKLAIYALAGTLAALEAVIEVARLSTAQPAAGVGYELTAIGAVIIGGASLNGGEGTILGTMLGSVLLVLITNGLILLHWSSYWQQVIMGAIIVVAVTLDTWRHRRR